jgi:uncharacterized membrane protein YhaH (DUF805 family)
MPPVGHFFSFRGRSPRREFGWIWLAMALLEGVRSGIVSLSVDEARMKAVTALPLDLLSLWLLFAFAVRRLHDFGWRGRWALVGAPAAFLSVSRDWVAVRDHLAFVPNAHGAMLWLALASVLAFWGLMLPNDDPRPNRYGPNPRDAAPDEEAQLA